LKNYLTKVKFLVYDFKHEHETVRSLERNLEEDEIAHDRMIISEDSQSGFELNCFKSEEMRCFN